MGKTRIAKDELVEKIKEELGMQDEVSQVERVPQVSQGERPRDTRDTLKTRGTPKKAKPRSKKYQEVSKDLDRSKSYPIPEAIELAKKLSYSKFPGTLEAHINTVQTGVIHRSVGKLSQPTDELSANLSTLLQTVGKTKIKKVTLSPTMGPSVRVDLG